MENLTDGQTMDKILEYCLSKEERSAGPNELTNYALQSVTIEEVMYLLGKIHDYNQGIAKVVLLDYQEGIFCTNLTEGFLKKGGFTAVEESQFDSDIKEKERSEWEIKNYQATVQMAEDNIRIYRFNRLAMIINAIILVANIAAIIWQILSIS